MHVWVCVCIILCAKYRMFILINKNLIDSMYRQMKKVRILGAWLIIKEIHKKSSSQSTALLVLKAPNHLSVTRTALKIWSNFNPRTMTVLTSLLFSATNTAQLLCLFPL